MALNAPDVDPEVKPTSLTAASGFWSAIGGLLGIAIDVLPFLPPVPPPWDKWVIFAGVVGGAILNRFFNDSYRPKI